MRDSNAHLDGVQVEYNEKFPNGLMYPADPQGQPSEVYNCRCTLIADVLGMRGKRTSNTVESYEKWINEKNEISALYPKNNNLKESTFISRYKNKTGKMTAKEYLDYKRELEYAEKLKTVEVDYKECAKVRHELNNNLSDEDRKHGVIVKYIDNYRYTVINYGFDSYRIVGKSMINSVYKVWKNGKRNK